MNLVAGLLASLFFVVHSPLSAQSRGGNQYGDCSFLCANIPDDRDVAKEFGASAEPQLRDSHLNILVWNLYKGRKPGFLKTFAALGANRDIVMVSEATSADPVTTAFEGLPGFGWNFSTSFNMKDNVGTGTAIGSYAQAQNVRHLRTVDLEPGSKTPKAMTLAEFDIAGESKKLLVISIHGINWSGDDAIVRQVQQAIPDIKSHQGPVIFAGDFNFKNSTRLQSIKNILAPLGLQRVNWKNPSVKPAQLDDAFARGVIVRRAYLNNSYMNVGSDHPAIELEVEIDPKG